MRRFLFAVSGLVFLCLVGGLIYSWDNWFGGEEPGKQVAEAPVEQALPYVPTILDLAGDPLIISIGQGGDGIPKVRKIATPDKSARSAGS